MHRLIAGEHLANLFFTMDRVHYKHPWPNTYRTCTRLEIAIQTLQASNMPVTTNAIPFLSIGADHACEHLNKLMKVHSGLMGFSSNANARLHFLWLLMNYQAYPTISTISLVLKHVNLDSITALREML